MEKMRKNIRRVFWLYFVLFAMVVSYLLKFVLIDSKNIITNSYNPRIKTVDHNLKRGDIVDSKGIVLAVSEENVNGYSRKYPQGNLFAHTVGFPELGGSGVEQKYNFQLQNLDLELVQRINNIVFKNELKGDSVVLTLDSELQKIAFDGLSKYKGAVVVMEPSTGKILAMASNPAFDLNEVAPLWEDLKSDSENSPLINRGTQGLYPPGSIFKILTAAALMEYVPEIQDFEYTCKGAETFGNNKIRCFDGKAHGTVNLEKAITVSCNTYFAAAMEKLNPNDFRQMAEKAFFNKDYPFSLDKNKSSFVLNELSSQSEIIETSFGQGKTLVTPLHMAMIVSSVANGGLMMEPYVVDHLSTFYGSQKSKRMPKMLARVFTTEQAEGLTKMMTEVVKSGTGTRAAIQDVVVAGKTGTAENSGGDDHGWFVAFAPADNPKIAVAIVLENSGGPYQALPLAKKIIEKGLS